MTRENVYKLIDGEREYQDSIWNCNTTSSCGIHTPEEWILYIEDYLAEAKHILARRSVATSYPEAMAIFRKVASMCVAAMEQRETPPRLQNIPRL